MQQEPIKPNSAETNENSTAKREMPPVTPATIVMTCIFALLFAIGYTFFPYIQMLLPFGGMTYNSELPIREMSHEELIANADSVVVGKVIDKGQIVQDTTIKLNDGLGFIVYKEVTIKVTQVLYGNPYMEGDMLKTWELGGSYIDNSLKKPKKITVKYKNYAKLSKNAEVLLFLDNNNNILNEKYGLYKKHDDNTYYNYKNNLFSLDNIKTALNNRANNEQSPNE